MLREEKFMRQAIAKAKAGIRGGQTPFGAVIVKKEKVISCAHNVVWLTTDITAHAEVNAIRQACKKLKTIDLSGCDLYSTCEPCPMCFSAIHWANIDRLYYGARIKDAAKAGFNELMLSCRDVKRIGKSPVKIKSGILMKENVQLFQDWNSQPNLKVY